MGARKMPQINVIHVGLSQKQLHQLVIRISVNRFLKFELHDNHLVHIYCVQWKIHCFFE